MEIRHRRPWSRLDPLLADSLLAIGLTVFTWVNMAAPILLMRSGVRLRPEMGPFVFRVFVPSPLSFAIVAACFLPLAFRRRQPLAVLGIVTVAAASFELFRHPPALTILAPLIALYTVGTLYKRRTLLIAAAATAVPLLLTSLPAFQDARWLADLARIVAMIGVAAALGDAARAQRAYVAETERRAEEAEARAEEQARRRIDEERLRIARELHDVTAHSLSVVAVQSGAAAHVLDDDPEAARRALADIKRTSREALAELRSVVGSLRAAGDVDTTAPLAPTPGLARMSDLVRPLEEAGVRVSVDVVGDVAHLPQLVDASAYRIVQEALTNVLRHAGAGANVSVAVRAEGDSLEIEVADDGPGARTSTGDGHGIPGMRERALALGGAFEAGPRPEGGWRVAAMLPMKARRQS